MDKEDVKQTCLDLSNASIALFDIVDADGVDAPMDSHVNLMKLKAVIENSEKIRAYYERRNISRMFALGYTPQQLLELAKR